MFLSWEQIMPHQDCLFPDKTFSDELNFIFVSNDLDKASLAVPHRVCRLDTAMFGCCGGYKVVGQIWPFLVATIRACLNLHFYLIPSLQPHVELNEDEY
jgi:hypothetical protein